jgi:hypothetical protein
MQKTRDLYRDDIPVAIIVVVTSVGSSLNSTLISVQRALK